MKLLARYNTAHGGTLATIEVDDKYRYDFPTVWWWVSKLDLPADFKGELKKQFVMIYQPEGQFS